MKISRLFLMLFLAVMLTFQPTFSFASPDEQAENGQKSKAEEVKSESEAEAKATGIFEPKGHKLMERFLKEC